jgi:hypothetical protein
MTDEHPADKILGADWRPPNRVRLEQAWDAHEQAELLNELKAERDQNGDPIWMLVCEPEPTDSSWLQYVLRTVDPLDDRPDIRVCRWPVQVETDADADVKAIVDEHDELT